MRLFTLALLCAAAVPAHAAQLTCFGSNPNWQAVLNGPSATFQLRDRAGDFQVRLTTPAKNDPNTTAYTLIGDTDTAIVIVSPARCNTLNLQAHVLTQERSEAILLSGCCRITEE